MSRSITTELPEELLKAILVRLDDTRWSFEDMPKRGLTSCSLTCRYWARFVRPLLFCQLVLRSREDEALLQAFLATPDFLGRSIGDSMVSLALIYDGPASGIPWTLLRPTQSMIPPHVEIRVEWCMAGGEARSGQKWPTYLLYRVLPRTLPPLATYGTFSITLRNLFIPICDFLRSLQSLRFSKLNIENVFFDGGEDLALLQALPVLLLGNGRAATSRKCDIHFQGISISALPYWNTVGNLVLSTQRLQMSNGRLVESISSHLSLCMDIHDTGHKTYDLIIKGSFGESWYHGLYGGRHIFASISTKVVDAGAAHVRSIQFRCPDLKDRARAFGAIDQLCLALTNTVTAPMSCLRILCGSAVILRTLVHGILEEHLLTDPKVSGVLLKGIWVHRVCHYAVHEIKAIPAEVVLHNGTTLPLINIQRVELLYLSTEKARERYLSKLRKAADRFGRATEVEVKGDE